MANDRHLFSSCLEQRWNFVNYLQLPNAILLFPHNERLFKRGSSKLHYLSIIAFHFMFVDFVNVFS
jgi:hypothetical protein